MSKIFYYLPNDIIDRTIHIGLLDVLQANKYTILLEPAQLKGERIDIAYIAYNEQLMSQIGDMNIRKISLIVKGDDDIIVPRNFIKYSSDLMETPTGKYYNVILNNRNYKTDIEIIIQGVDNVYQDVVRNIYTLYGNVITCTMKKYNIAEIETQVKMRSIPNSGNVYCNVHCMVEGLKQCTIRKYVIKVRPDEHFSEITPVLNSLQNDDRIVITNLYAKKVSQSKYSICDHFIAGKFEQLLQMYVNAQSILNNRICDIRKKMRLEYTPDQIITVGYLKDVINYIGSRDEQCVKNTMVKYFNMIPIDELGHFRVPVGNQIMVSGKTLSRDTYDMVCPFKTIDKL